MTKGLCVHCGKVYNETPYSFLCPKCRKEIQSENAKKINLSEIGNKAMQGCCEKEVMAMPDNRLHLFDILSLVEGYAEQGEREHNVAHNGDCASVIRWLHENKLLDMERVHQYCDERGVNINGKS